VTLRLETAAVAVVVWKKLLQDMMLDVPDPFEQFRQHPRRVGPE